MTRTYCSLRNTVKCLDNFCVTVFVSLRVSTNKCAIIFFFFSSPLHGLAWHEQAQARRVGQRSRALRGTCQAGTHPARDRPNPARRKATCHPAPHAFMRSRLNDWLQLIAINLRSSLSKWTNWFAVLTTTSSGSSAPGAYMSCHLYVCLARVTSTRDSWLQVDQV